MGRADIVRVVILLSAVMILRTKQTEMLEESLPNAGDQYQGARILHYRNVLGLTGRNFIRLAVKGVLYSILGPDLLGLTVAV